MRSEEYGRLTYHGSGLEQIDTDAPEFTCMLLLERWWSDAIVDERVTEPAAAALATHDVASGLPDCRILLVKDFDRDGLRFFTNRASAKGTQLASHPAAALTLLWHPMFRQVRFRGLIVPTSREEDIEYWQSRPQASQLASWTSRQSQTITDRYRLTKTLRQAEERFHGGAVPLPEQWGGYRLRPLEVEFWVGMPARLHDRVVWRRTDETPGRLDTTEGWTCERLQP